MLTTDKMLATDEKQDSEVSLRETKPNTNSHDNAETTVARPSKAQARLERVLRIEWLGQTVASVCWIASVLIVGIGSTGDWLQLLAASSWLVANIAAAVTVTAD